MSSSPPVSAGVNFSVNPPVVQSRKRALTKTLLGSDYEEIITTIPDPPQPLQNISGYTSDRVRQGLKFADATLRNETRKLSPAGGIALELYKDTCVGLLDMLDVEEGEIFDSSYEERKAVEDCHRVFIREAEKGFQMHACMQATKTTAAQQLQEEILNLQRTAFYGRYGDYFAEICNKLKLAAERGKLPGWQTLSKVYWSDVARRVDTESPVYQRHLNGETGLQAEMPTTYAITVACYNIGLDPVDTLQIVKQYGIRNDLLHANLLPMIKKGLFADLAKRLCLDRTEIVLLAPASEQADRNIVERLLDSMIDLWFDREESDLANYQMWTAKPQLKAYYRELNINSPIENEVAVNQKISEDITKAFKKNLQKSMKEDELAE